MKIRTVDDLPPGASPELKVLMHLNERLGELTLFATSEAIDTRTMLGMIIDLLKLVLVEQGYSKELIQEALEKSGTANKTNAESFVQERLKLCSLKAKE